MEKRIGAAIILVNNTESVPPLNHILSKHSDIIRGRQGIPIKDREVNIITIVLEGTTDQISSLTGQIGRLSGVEVKSALVKNSLNKTKES